MTDPDLISLFIHPLEELGVSYMITGGVASVIYGDPRLTRDVDIVLELPDTEIEPLVSAFPDDRFYVPPVESLEQEIARPEGGHFNLIHHDTALRADIYLRGNDPLHTWGFDRRQRLLAEQVEIWVAPVEYVIVRKLEYLRMSGSDRHLRDVAMILQVSGDMVDAAVLNRWIEKLDLKGALDAARAYPL